MPGPRDPQDFRDLSWPRAQLSATLNFCYPAAVDQRHGGYLSLPNANGTVLDDPQKHLVTAPASPSVATGNDDYRRDCDRAWRHGPTCRSAHDGWFKASALAITNARIHGKATGSTPATTPPEPASRQCAAWNWRMGSPAAWVAVRIPSMPTGTRSVLQGGSRTAVS
jgi:hypothetical protein